MSGPVHGPAPDAVAAGDAGAVAIVQPGPPGLPTTLVLRGPIDRLTAPGLGAMVAAAAATGELLVDASGVDRFDSTTWRALAEGCARVVEAGRAVRIIGLRWSQLLDVLAAASVVQVPELLAGMRSLRSQPDRRPPGTTPTEGADPTPEPRVPRPRTPPVGVAPGPAPARPPVAARAMTDHLPRDWTRADPGARRE